MLAAHNRAPQFLRERSRHAGVSWGRGRLHVCNAVKQRAGKQICCSKTLKANKGSEVGVRGGAVVPLSYRSDSLAVDSEYRHLLRCC